MPENKSTFDFTIIEAILNDIHEVECTMSQLPSIKKELKQRLPEALVEASKESNLDDKVFAAWVLYWHVKELEAGSIAKNLFNVSVETMRKKFIKHGLPCSLKCCKCEKSIEAEHRQNIAFHRSLARAHGYEIYSSRFEETVMCFECASSYLNAIESMTIKIPTFEDHLKEDTIETLRNMPYTEYLKSEHWQERRLRHLRSSGFRCQLCNSDNIKLHVHHRTYERKGCERFSDLIVLCEECHTIFHDRQVLK